MPPEIVLNQWVSKGWGGEHIVVNTPEYCGKRLLVLAGRRCSVHYHEQKTETFCVQSGRLQVDIREGDTIKAHFLEPGQVLHIPAGTIHQFMASRDTWLLEFSTHDDPADSIKLERGDVLPSERERPRPQPPGILDVPRGMDITSYGAGYKAGWQERALRDPPAMNRHIPLEGARPENGT